MQRGESIWFMLVKDHSGCSTEDRPEWEREKSRAGRQSGGLCNAQGEQRMVVWI